MYKDVSLSDVERLEKSARGRNGWFSPRTIEVQQIPSWKKQGNIEISIAVISKRQGNEPPIWLRLPRDKALELAETIKEMANDDPAIYTVLRSDIALAVEGDEEYTDKMTPAVIDEVTRRFGKRDFSDLAEEITMLIDDVLDDSPELYIRPLREESQ